uniref:Uncharacterized protein n=1 Tax=Populus alba TaxID=43335 RepID=A0A4U5QRT0_POPAL|nr:hypothetical protein D5086_0000067430 [Populus alba]
MNYSLAALKLLRVQLKDASETLSQNALTLGGILFQRAWVQGILVSNDGDGRLLLDDGTGVIELCLSGDFCLRHWDLGMYVMVVGGYLVRPVETPISRELGGIIRFIQVSCLGASASSPSRVLRAKAAGEEAVLREMHEVNI